MYSVMYLSFGMNQKLNNNFFSSVSHYHTLLKPSGQPLIVKQYFQIILYPKLALFE